MVRPTQEEQLYQLHLTLQLLILKQATPFITELEGPEPLLTVAIMAEAARLLLLLYVHLLKIMVEAEAELLIYVKITMLPILVTQLRILAFWWPAAGVAGVCLGLAVLLPYPVLDQHLAPAMATPEVGIVLAVEQLNQRA